MANVMKRVLMVVLLSTALVLVSGQAQAEAKGARNALQRLSGKVVEVMERESTLVALFCSTALCAGSASLMHILGLAEHPGVGTLVSLSFFSATLSSYLAFSKHREAEKDIGEAYRSGVEDVMDLVVEKLHGDSQLWIANEVKIGAIGATGLYFWMLQFVIPNDAGVADKVFSRINALVKENGSFPLTVARDGLTFNNGVFISYTDLFGEGNFHHRTREETSEEVLDAADD